MKRTIALILCCLSLNSKIIPSDQNSLYNFIPWSPEEIKKVVKVKKLLSESLPCVNANAVSEDMLDALFKKNCSILKSKIKKTICPLCDRQLSGISKVIDHLASHYLQNARHTIFKDITPVICCGNIYFARNIRFYHHIKKPKHLSNMESLRNEKNSEDGNHLMKNKKYSKKKNSAVIQKQSTKKITIAMLLNK